MTLFQKWTWFSASGRDSSSKLKSYRSRRSFPACTCSTTCCLGSSSGSGCQTHLKLVASQPRAWGKRRVRIATRESQDGQVATTKRAREARAGGSAISAASNCSSSGNGEGMSRRGCHGDDVYGSQINDARDLRFCEGAFFGCRAVERLESAPTGE